MKILFVLRSEFYRFILTYQPTRNIFSFCDAFNIHLFLSFPSFS